MLIKLINEHNDKILVNLKHISHVYESIDGERTLSNLIMIDGGELTVRDSLNDILFLSKRKN